MRSLQLVRLFAHIELVNLRTLLQLHGSLLPVLRRPSLARKPHHFQVEHHKAHYRLEQLTALSPIQQAQLYTRPRNAQRGLCSGEGCYEHS